MLELVLDRPDWLNALGVALTRPPGVPERRQGQDPWHPEAEATESRPRRIADDLAWLRQAYDEPEENGLTPLKDTAAVASGIAAAAAGSESEAHANLVFRDGRTWYGPLPLGPAPRVW